MPLTGDGQVNKKAFRIAINSRQLARFHPLDREKTVQKQGRFVYAQLAKNSRENPLLLSEAFSSIRRVNVGLFMD
jgi:hypothetical protein